VLALLDEQKAVAMPDDNRGEVPGGDWLACQRRIDGETGRAL
jgi:hypothetical protein